jgi:3-methyl-2-oxobutanoate hydroxymethyltransferase
MPIHSYDTNEQAVDTAKILMAAGAQAVKLEGGWGECGKIERIVDAGIPVMAHIGMLPQHVREEGGYKVKGKSPRESEQLLDDAKCVQHAGAFSVVLELVTPETARHITETLEIPTIGIGSGSHCDGQILVTHDLIGLFPWFTPKFVSPEARVADEIRRAAQAFIARTKSGS